jgi:hypothetical protein
MSKTNADVKEYEKLEDDIIDEVSAAIGDLCDGDEKSVIKDVQPPESVINAMARAAAAVLIAFEHGYRLGG